jgi:polysaccharide deacetylase 2 family uncharacterized protein YibQ
VAQKKKGSAKRRVQAKRQQQRKAARRRLSLSVLGFLGLSTLLGFAFFLGGGAQQGEGAPTQREARVEKKASRPAMHETMVAEEYPPESQEEKVGFGLEDLIHKTRQKTEKEQARTSVASPEKRSAVAKSRKPQLVLIIDDISQRRQLEAIRKLPYRITPSIFPPSRMNARSNLLARGMRHYMIHLPLESGSAKMNRFSKTLMVDDGPRAIARRVTEIRHLFPDARFVNNHTGSVFTSNHGAMYHLYGDLKREGFVFVDSRTSAHSVVRKVAAEYHSPYLARDVFIDNVQNRSAILKQLRKAVRIAKKRGYAIAIGHPHRATFDALRHAGGILSQVETVYLDDFYRSRYGR